MKEIRYKQAIYSLGKFSGWHYWGFIARNFVSPVCEIDGLRILPETAHKNSQQFTGLLDKKGKEIYEGDILVGSNPQWTINGFRDYDKLKVDYFEGGFYPFADGEDNAPYPQAKDVTVIGNIYENPELLEK